MEIKKRNTITNKKLLFILIAIQTGKEEGKGLSRVKKVSDTYGFAFALRENNS